MHIHISLYACRMYHRYRVDLYYRNECPVKGVDEQCAQRTKYSMKGEPTIKKGSKVWEKDEGITVQAIWKQEGKASRQEE